MLTLNLNYNTYGNPVPGTVDFTKEKRGYYSISTNHSSVANLNNWEASQKGLNEGFISQMTIAAGLERKRAGLLNNLMPSAIDKYKDLKAVSIINDLIDDKVKELGLSGPEYSILHQDDVGRGVDIEEHNRIAIQKRSELRAKYNLEEEAVKLAKVEGDFLQEMENVGDALTEENLGKVANFLGAAVGRMTLFEEYAFGALGYKTVSLFNGAILKLASVATSFSQNGVYRYIIRDMIKFGSMAAVQEVFPQISIAKNMKKSNIPYTMQEAAFSIMAVGFMGAVMGGFAGGFSGYKAKTKMNSFRKHLDSHNKYISEYTADSKMMKKFGGVQKFTEQIEELEKFSLYLKEQADKGILPDVPIEEYMTTQASLKKIDVQAFIDKLEKNNIYSSYQWEQITDKAREKAAGQKKELLKTTKLKDKYYNDAARVEAKTPEAVDLLTYNNETWTYKDLVAGKKIAKHLLGLDAKRRIFEQEINPDAYVASRIKELRNRLSSASVKKHPKATLEFVKRTLIDHKKRVLKSKQDYFAGEIPELDEFAVKINAKKTLEETGMVDAKGDLIQKFKKLALSREKEFLESEATEVKARVATWTEEQVATAKNEYIKNLIDSDAIINGVTRVAKGNKGLREFFEGGTMPLLRQIGYDIDSLKQVLAQPLSGIEESIGSAYDMARPKMSAHRSFLKAVLTGETKELTDQAFVKLSLGSRKLFNKALNMLEDYGFNVSEELKDNFLPVMYVAAKVRKEAKEQFVSYFLKKVDPEKTAKKLKTTKIKDIGKFLSDMYDNILTEGMIETNGRQPLLNEAKLHFRSLVFKSADDQIDVIIKYGPEKITDYFSQYIASTAKSVSIRKNLGATVNRNLRMIDDAAMPDFAKGNSIGAQAWRSIKKAYEKTAIGPTDGVYHQAIADTGSLFRSAGVVGYLWSSLWSAFIDPIWTFSSVAVKTGSIYKGMKDAGDVFKGIFVKDKVGRDMLEQLGFGLEYYMESGSARLIGSLLSGKGSKYSNNILALTGMPSWTEHVKRVVRKSALKEITAAIDAPNWNAINYYTKKQLRRFGITETDIKFIKKNKYVAGKGDLRFVDLGAIDNTNLNLGLKIHDWVNESARLGSPSPDTLIRSLQSWGYRTGSFSGEWRKLFLQFTSFAMATVRNSHYVISNSETYGQAAKVLLPMAAAATALGTIIVQIKEMLKGRSPRDLDESLVLEGFLLSGMVPLLLEKPIAGMGLRNETFFESVLDFPALGLLNNTYDAIAAFANYDKKTGEWSPNPDKAIRHMFRFMPGFNLWYSKAILETAIMNPFRAFVSPKNAKRAMQGSEGALKKRGQSAWTYEVAKSLFE